jgi:hypothetical protein
VVASLDGARTTPDDFGSEELLSFVDRVEHLTENR